MTKRERLDALLDDRDLAAVWFARPNSVAWLTGANNVVDRESDVGVAAVGYDGEELEVVTSNVEAERLREEEVSGEIPVIAFDWYERSLAEAVADRSPDPAAADFDVPGFESVDASPLRHPLTDEDVARYRELGRQTAAAVEAVCRELQPGDTESEVASALRVALFARNIESPVALVGGAERARKHRHYTPTDAELGAYALVSVTAQRGGLHASATRTVAFESAIDDAELAELRERHDAASAEEWVEGTSLPAMPGRAEPPAASSRRYRTPTRPSVIQTSGSATIRAARPGSRVGSGSPRRTPRTPSPRRWPTRGTRPCRARRARTQCWSVARAVGAAARAATMRTSSRC